MPYPTGRVGIRSAASVSPPPPPPPPPPPLDVDIAPTGATYYRTGPGIIHIDFTATISGGSGSYTGNWFSTTHGINNFLEVNLANGETLTGAISFTATDLVTGQNGVDQENFTFISNPI